VDVASTWPYESPNRRFGTSSEDEVSRRVKKVKLIVLLCILIALCLTSFISLARWLKNCKSEKTAIVGILLWFVGVWLCLYMPGRYTLWQTFFCASACFVVSTVVSIVNIK
jgi:hypothetical protein